MEVAIKSGQEMKATMRASQEKMEASTNSIQFKLDEAIKKSGGICPIICQPTDTVSL
jgi:hypothetical protein